MQSQRYSISFSALLIILFLLAAGCGGASEVGGEPSTQGPDPVSAAQNPGSVEPGEPGGQEPAEPGEPASPAATGSFGEPQDSSEPEGEPGPYEPNELGRVMVLVYHLIGEEEGRWTRTPENFRRDLERLYDAGFRPVNLRELVRGEIDLPRGYVPVVLTFDDGSEGQFRILADGTVDPKSAVGVMEVFNAEHPDWSLRATFYINADPFGQRQLVDEKLRHLAEQGFEVGNHTFGHVDLSRYGADATVSQLARLEAQVRAAVEGYETVTMAYPFGREPAVPAAVREGSLDETSYAIEAGVLVGAHPAASPYDAGFDPYRIPRVQVVDPAITYPATFDYWLDEFLKEPPKDFFVSDGRVDAVTIPKEKVDRLADWVRERFEVVAE